MTPSTQSAASLGRLSVAAFGLVAAINAWSIVERARAFTTYAGRSELAATLFVSAGLGLIAAGLITSRRRPILGAVSVVAGFVWFAPAWEGWEGGPSLVRSAGMLAARLVFPVLVHLVVVAGTAAVARVSSLVVGSTYALLGGGAVLLALVRDPYLDPHCWTDCTTNLLVVSARPRLASTVETASLWLTAIVAVALIAICVSSSSIPSTRRRHGVVLTGGMVLGVATIARSLLTVGHGFEDPSATSSTIVFLAQCSASLLIAFGLLWSPLYSRRVRRAVAGVVAELDEASAVGSLESALTHATRDPNLHVSYWLAATDRYSDALGHAVCKPSSNARTVATPVMRNGNRIAVISHESDPRELDRILGSDLRLALDNERLQAEVLAQMNDLRDSRQRIIEAGDERRRELERNLHDGAQQTLLGLSYDLRRARATAAATGDEDLAALLDSASTEVAQAFTELRELAHGIFPAVLSQAGLAPAIASLGETAHIPIDVHCAITERLSAPVETTVYFVVADGVRVATESRAAGTVVTVVRRDCHVVVDVTPDRADVFMHTDMTRIADRVGAVGGALRMDTTGLRAEIPCGS